MRLTALLTHSQCHSNPGIDALLLLRTFYSVAPWKVLPACQPACPPACRPTYLDRVESARLESVRIRIQSFRFSTSPSTWSDHAQDLCFVGGKLSETLHCAGENCPRIDLRFRCVYDLRNHRDRSRDLGTASHDASVVSLNSWLWHSQFRNMRVCSSMRVSYRAL